MTWRFTLSHSVLGSEVISEPGGWKDHVLTMVRHPVFFSLVESIEAQLIFYGNDGVDNGGMDFINSVEDTYGFNADIELLIERADDDVTFTSYFDGKFTLSALEKRHDNTATIPLLQNNKWATLLNRYETPVNMSDTTDLDGNAVSAVTPITMYMTPQRIRKKYHAYYDDSGDSYAQFTNNSYYHVDFNDVILFDEVQERYTVPRIEDVVRPDPLFITREPGRYAFDCRIIASTFSVFNAESVKNPTDFIDFFIQFGDQTPIAFSWADESVGAGVHTLFTLNATYELTANTPIRIYGQANTTSTQDLVIAGGNSTGFSGTSEWASYLLITTDTTFQATEAEGYLIHDLLYGALKRIGCDALYSEYLGSALTTTRQYDDDGCAWMYGVFKGLQIRTYTLAEKPFFISLKQIWEGINPILNLGLGYETVLGEEVIRVEQKTHFVQFNAASPVNFSDVAELSYTYDNDVIFKAIRIGYRQWQAEDISGLDDPQTKRTYATIFKEKGMEINLESDFIAAGLAIELTRRESQEKQADYKFDNNNFIIAINTDDLSPDVYLPELDEGFSSVTNLVNSDSRYNLMLTPVRNLLRWLNYLSGCLQLYLSSNFKFVSGEGNYDMESDAIIEILCQRSVSTSNLSESEDVAPDGTNYLFLPKLFNIIIPMEKADYDLIDRKKPIGISQSSSGHVKFIIKNIEYEFLKGEATIHAWPRTSFDITVPEQTITMRECAPEGSGVVYDADYQAVLDYGDAQGYTLPSEAQKAVENQKLLDMKAEGIWDDLDLFYYLETHGDRDYARINWKNPGTNNAEEVGTLTFTPGSGFTGNAVNAYLTTGWAPDPDGVNYTLDECGAFCKVNNEISGGNKAAFGVRGNSGHGLNGQLLLFPDDTTNTHTFSLHNLANTVGSTVDSLGFYQIRRVADNDSRLFKNGVQVGGILTTASDSLSTQDLFIIALNSNGGAGFHSDLQIGVFGIGASLTGKESALNDIFN